MFPLFVPSAVAARNWALFLSAFEIVSLARHFILGQNFVEISGFWGSSPTIEQQRVFWIVVSILAICRFAFAANYQSKHWAQFVACVHILEVIPVALGVSYGHRAELSSGKFAALEPLTWSKTLQQSSAIFVVIIFNAFFFYWFADSIMIDMSKISPVRSKSVSRSVEPTPPVKKSTSRKSSAGRKSSSKKK